MILVPSPASAVVGDDDELLGDELLGSAAAVTGVEVACVAIALIDELSNAVGGAGVAAAAGLFNDEVPLNGAKKSRLNAA